MDDVLRCLENDDWPLALVSLAAHASPPRLAQWEQALPRTGHAQRVEHWHGALQGRVPSRAELEREPLALLSALDRLVAASRPPRFTEATLSAGGRNWWLVPVTARWRSAARLRRQVGRLDRHLHHHAIVPAGAGTQAAPLKVRCIAVAGELAHEMEDLAQNPEAQIGAWIAHFDDGCVVQWHSPHPSGRVIATGIDPAESRTASLHASLRHAIDGKAWLWLAPELSLTPDQQREAVDTALAHTGEAALRLIAPGSWHHPVEGGHANLATLHDGFNGDALLTHRKLRVFGNYGNGSESEKAEGVVPGDEVTLLVTPVGNWTLLICKDFLDADASVAGLVQQIAADWVLVPSYGDEETSRAQARRARQVCRIEGACHVLVATLRNCGIPGPTTAPPHLPGFAHLAGEAEPHAVPASGGQVVIALQLSAPPVPPFTAPRLRLVRESRHLLTKLND